MRLRDARSAAEEDADGELTGGQAQGALNLSVVGNLCGVANHDMLRCLAGKAVDRHRPTRSQDRG